MRRLSALRLRLQIIWAESSWQEFGHSRGLVDRAAHSACLVQELAAASARVQQVAVSIRHRHRHEAAAACSVQIGNEAAFSTQGQPVGGILDIASDDDAAVINQTGGTDKESRIRRVRVSGRRSGTLAKLMPIDHVSVLHAIPPIPRSRYPTRSWIGYH